MTDISVVMVSYHTGPSLWLAIEATLAQPECRELLLVDNGNTPGVLKRLNDLAGREPRLKLITGHGNVGFAKGCNLGARAASADYLLLLNPDSMLPEGGLARGLETLRKFPENTLAGCYLLDPDGTEQRGGRRAILTPKNAVAESLGLGAVAGGQAALNLHGTPMPEHAHEVPAISGAFMMLARAFYERLGGLDEGYFLHMEDMDFCYRVQQAGGKIICMPEVPVIHFRSTSDASGATVERHKAKSFIRYLRLHFSKEYSGLSMLCLTAGIWLRYVLKIIMGTLDRAFVPPLAARRDVARVVLLYRLAYFGPSDDSLKGKTILVTGGSGQTGVCVVGKALARGARVIAMYNQTVIPFRHPNLTWLQQDLHNKIGDIKADILIHTAALWLLPDAIAGILDKGITRIIAFGSTSMLVKAESDNEYEKGIAEKLRTAEEQIMHLTVAKGGNVTFLRPTMIYGVGLDVNIMRLTDLIRRVGFLAVHGAGSGRRQPVQALDLADTALNIVYTPATYGRAYNLGGGSIITYYEMLVLLFTYLGKRPRIYRPPALPQLLNGLGKLYQVPHINGEIALRMNQDLVFDMSDPIHDFAYHPHGFLEGDVIV